MTTGRLRRNIAGLLVSTVDTEADLYDSTAVWRDRAIAGTLHSGSVLTGGPGTGPVSDRLPVQGGSGSWAVGRTPRIPVMPVIRVSRSGICR